MLDKSFGLLFYLKKPKNYGKGPIPIYLRITVDGIPKELSVKRDWDPNRWNSAAGRASGTKEDAKALNAYLDTFQTKVYEAKRYLIEGNKIVTASAIKNVLANNFEAFLQQTLSNLQNKQIGLLRADTGFHSKKIFELLENRATPISYIIACPIYVTIRRTIQSSMVWLRLDDGIEIVQTD